MSLSRWTAQVDTDRYSYMTEQQNTRGYSEFVHIFIVLTALFEWAWKNPAPCTFFPLNTGLPPDDYHTNATNQAPDVFSCLSGSCGRPPPCSTVRPSQSFILLCRNVLPRLLPTWDLLQSSLLPKQTARELARCADATRSDTEIIQAASSLTDILKTVRPCSPRYGYRYPECTYNDRFWERKWQGLLRSTRSVEGWGGTSERLTVHWHFRGKKQNAIKHHSWILS